MTDGGCAQCRIDRQLTFTNVKLWGWEGNGVGTGTEAVWMGTVSMETDGDGV